MRGFKTKMSSRQRHIVSSKSILNEELIIYKTKVQESVKLYIVLRIMEIQIKQHWVCCVKYPWCSCPNPTWHFGFKTLLHKIINAFRQPWTDSRMTKTTWLDESFEGTRHAVAVINTICSLPRRFKISTDLTLKN